MSTTLLPVRFEGVQEGTDPKALPPGTLLTAENCAMDKARRLIKRAGIVAVDRVVGVHPELDTEDFPLTAGVRLQTRGTDLVVSDGTRPYLRGQERWKIQNRAPKHQITKRTLSDTTSSTSSASVAVSGDYLATAFVMGYDGTLGARVMLQVENVDTGVKELIPTPIGYATNACVVAVPGGGPGGRASFLVVWDDFNTGWIRGRAYTLEHGLHPQFNVSTAANAVLSTSLSDQVPLDAQIAAMTSGSYAGANVLAVGYVGAAGTDRQRFVLATVNVNTDTYTNVLNTTVVTGFGPSTTYSVGVDAHPTLGFLMVASDNVAGVGGGWLTRWNPSGSLDATYSVDSSARLNHVWAKYYTHPTLGDGVVFGRTRNAVIFGNAQQPLKTDFRLLASLATAEAGTTRRTWHVQYVTQPWFEGDRTGRIFCGATLFPKTSDTTSTETIPNATSVLLEIEVPSAATDGPDTTHAHMGTLENLTAWVALGQGFCGSVAKHSSGDAFVPQPYRNAEPKNFVALPVGWSIFRARSVVGDSHRLMTVGTGALAVGAAPYWVDGASSWPYGFAHAPMIRSWSLGAAASGSMAAGTYDYVAVYTWRDANGVLHRSTPSPRVTVAGVNANGSVILSITTASLSSKMRKYGAATTNPVVIELYRTEVGGANVHKLTRAPLYNVILNDPDASTVTFTDTRSDASITGASPVIALNTQAQVYTATSELDDIPPPAATTGTAHRGRIVLIDATEKTAWFSKDYSEDPLVAPGFNEALTIAFALPKKAVAGLDEKWVFFGESDIDIVHGVGPDATGNGAWDVNRLQTDVGCTNPRSLATTPMGVVFESARGIELLSRDLSISWVGKVVEDTLRDFPTITSATVVADKHEVRWTCTSEDGLTGIVLAWDYTHQIWFVRKYKDAAGTESIPFVDAALVGGVYSLLDATGIVYQETEASWLDCGTYYVETDVLLAPLSPSGSNLGWHRVKDVTIQGTSHTRHKLQISARRDYATAWQQLRTFDETSPVTEVGPIERARVTFAVQKCQAMQVRIRDLAPASDYGTGQGMTLEGLAFRVMTLDGPAKPNTGEQG